MVEAAAAAKDEGDKPAKRGRKGGLAFLALGLGTGIALGVALPTGLLLVMGLIPAAICYAADAHPEKTTARPVLCLNLAGLLPALKTLWLGAHDLRGLAAIVGDPLTLLLAYAAAAFGFALARTIPYGVLLLLEADAAATIKQLEAKQEELTDARGTEVANDATRIAFRMTKAPKNTAETE